MIICSNGLNVGKEVNIEFIHGSIA